MAGVIPRWSGKVERAALRAVAVRGYDWGYDADYGHSAVVHVGTVWSAALMSVGATNDLEFGVRVARHATGCQVCGSRPGLVVWTAVLRYAGVGDVLRVLQQQQKEAGR